MAVTSTLEYSNDALEVKSLFYNKRITVYVEGEDDIIFWDHIFSLAGKDAYIEEVGGRTELEKYFLKIVNDGADFFIAMDNDNSEFMDDRIIHPNIIRTYGYSIENSMYSNQISIVNTIAHLCRKKIDTSIEFNEWSNTFSTQLYDLIVFDIANNKYQKGISVFGDNCCRFLKTQHSHEICVNKLNVFLDNIRNKFDEDEINEVKRLITASKKDLWFLIKGHFITHSLINLIKRIVKRESKYSLTLNSDHIYSFTVDCREGWDQRIDIKSVVENIREVCI